MSDTGLFPVVCGDLETARGFGVLMRAHPVVESRPLNLAWVEFFFGKLSCVRPAPSLGGESFQRAGPAAPCLIEAIGVQAGENVGDRTPCAHEVAFWKAFERL